MTDIIISLFDLGFWDILRELWGDEIIMTTSRYLVGGGLV